MKRSFLPYSFFLMLILLSACSTTNVREHPTLEDQLLDVDSVLIITPTVTIEQINFSTDNERLTELENKIQRELVSFATLELDKRGYDVVEFDLENAIAEDEQLAYAVTQANEGFHEARKTLYESTVTESEKRKFRASIGTAVNIVSERSGADAILLIHFMGQKKSEGSVTKDIAVGVLLGLLTGQVAIAASEASYVEMAFIDGVSGDVLWSNITSTARLNLDAVDRLMQSFPDDIDTESGLSKAAKPGVKE